MSINRKIASLTVAVVIIAIIGSALAVSATFTAATNAGPENQPPADRHAPPWMANLTDTQKETLKQKMEELKTAGKTPQEIHSAMNDMLKQWGIQVPSGLMFSQLGGMALPMHRNFSAPRHWNYSRSVNVTIDSAQAKAVVNAAIPSFSVGEAKDRGNMWAVNITSNGTVVMNVPLGKINTPTSSDAVKAVQDSIGKGWSTGEPTQMRFIYRVPIIDADGNVIGYTLVNGVTGHITTGFSLLRNGHALQK